MTRSFKLLQETDRYLLRQIREMEPGYLGCVLVMAVASIVLPVLSVSLLQRIVDGLLGDKALSAVLFYVGILLVTGLVTAFFNRYMKIRLGSHEASFTDKMEARLAEISMKVRYELLDKEDYIRGSDRAYRPLRNQGALQGYARSISDLTQSVLLTITISGIIVSCNGIVLVIVISAAVAIWALNRYKLKIDLRYDDMMATIDRRYEYYDKLICDMSFGKEVRLYEMQDYIMKKIRTDNKQTLGGTFTSMYKAYGRIDGSCGMIKHLERVVICGLLVYSVLKGSLSIGGFTAALAASASLSRYINSLIESYFSYKKNVGYLKGLKEHLEKCEANEEPRQDPQDQDAGLLPIRFDDVSFRYEGAEHNALNHVDLTFEQNKRYAIVGENGAGKTTLVKLLLGFYTPQSGSVRINGEPDNGQIKGKSMPLFQQVNQYPDTIRRNITLGVDEDQKSFSKAVEFARLESLIAAHGAETCLCRDYDSAAIDLSGGEKQRVALARSIYQKGSVTIMDEPTSSMDPDMEMHVYTDLNSYRPQDCTIIVSHRMACCRFVDQVIVMKEGCVCAVGSHDDLLQKNEYYQKLWNAQAERYDE
jgi:ATP-binding cassette subfamily B protein/ATP-binding cassette subfamily C protein